MYTSDFDYDLPPQYIAQTPIEPRDASRLMVLDRQSRAIQHTQFYDIGNFLNRGDVLVLNKTRVIPARLLGHKLPSGGKVEILLLRKQNDLLWEALVGGKGISPGKKVAIKKDIISEVIEDKGGSRRLVSFTQPVETFLNQVGYIPLPPYIHTPLKDTERYQTIYAHDKGSVAAPTAGLHFTARLIEELQKEGIRFVYVTLHIGLDTFAPVTEENPQDHQIHTEWCQLSPQSAMVINEAKEAGKKVIAVGTTSVRVLESAARNSKRNGWVEPINATTDLYILPGYEFKIVNAMITNFHLPRSTLIMLVSAFAGRELVLSTYQTAIEAGYRFYSFGDAMLIV